MMKIDMPYKFVDFNRNNRFLLLSLLNDIGIGRREAGYVTNSQWKAGNNDDDELNGLLVTRIDKKKHQFQTLIILYSLRQE